MELAFGYMTDPARSMFRELKNKRAEVWSYYCAQADCPLRAKGQCTNAVLPGDACPYGKRQREEGPTRNARKYDDWRQEQLARIQGLKRPKDPATRLAFIGDYVYLPYAFMDMVGTPQDYARFDKWPHNTALPDIPWLGPARFMSPSCQFLPRSAWTLETVLRLIDGRPQAWLGGTITDYQQKSVPLFLRHLAEEDPVMWQQVIAARPQLDQPPVYVGRKALLRTLKPGITLGPRDPRYPVIWQWDGEYLVTHDKDAYNNTWGGLTLSEFTLTAVPAADAVIEVKDADWVTSQTVFID